VKVETSYNDDRTELTVTPTQDLVDGYRYNHNTSGSFTVADFVDARYGKSLNNASELDVDFSIGIDNSAPAVPSISYQPSELNDDGEIPAGRFDYTDGQVSVDLQVDDVDNSQAEVKGYEVFYVSQDIRADRDPVTGGDPFLQVGTYGNSGVTNTFSSTEVAVSENIVDASTDDFENGPVEFSVSTNDDHPFAVEEPFAAADGFYGDIQIKVRAVSINNQRSDFSDVITIADNDSLGLDDANTEYDDADSDGDDELVVSFDEPVSGISAGDDANNFFDITDSGGDATSIGDVVEVDNDGVDTSPGGSTGAEIVVEITDDGSNTSGDELTVDDETSANFVTDLAGNPIEVGNGDETTDTSDDNQDFSL